MNTHKNPVRNILSVAALTLCLTAPAALAGPVGEVSINAGGFSVVPTLDQKVAGYQLTVAGGEYHEIFTFKGAELPSFDAAGLADGAYTFELRAIPAKQFVIERPDNGYTQVATQTGSFTVQGGSVIDPDLREGGLTKDQVIATDLIVQGSACVGFDCATSESFSFDTLRLKENNLRLHFEDTSTSASFPGNDWRLTANDSTNGGANRFSIDDATGGKSVFYIEAGAPNNSFYVASEGRIGRKTSNPAVDIHITDGDSPSLRLEQDGSSGFTPQTWDLAANETNFFIRDVTNGSKLPFKIKPGADDNTLFIAASGNIGNLTASPSEALHVRRTDGTAKVLVQEASSTTDNTRTLLTLKNNGSARLTMENTAESDSWTITGPNADMSLTIDNTTNPGTEFTLTSDGNLTLASTLTIGGTCSGCDAVFSSDWPLESIEEQAAFMWENQYLPAVGPTAEGQTSIDVFAKTTGILQELEKAHIYIEQLHKGLESTDGEIEQALARLASLEAAQD